MKRKHSLFLLLPAVAMVTAGCNLFKHDNPGANNSGTQDSDGGNDDEGGGGGGQQTVAVTGVSLDVTAKTLEIGGKFTLVATVLPANADNKAVTWSSSNEAVATVTNGEVTAKAAGTAEITVTTADGGKTAKCVVTVNQAQQQTNYGTAEAPITVTQASAIAAAECAADGNLTAQEITVKGTVKAIRNTYHYDGIPCFEFDITDGTTDMYAYRCHTTIEQEALFVVGAKVTIVGFVKNFKGTIEFVDNGNDHQCHVISLEAEGVATPVSISALAGLPESVYVGDTLSAQGITASVLFTDGSSKDFPVSEITLNTSVAGQITGVAHYGQLQKEFVMTVLPLPEKVVGDFYRVASQDDITEGQYLIVYEGTEGAKIFNGLDAVNGCVDAQATGGHIVASDTLPKVELEAMEGGFAIKVLTGENANKYISGKSNNNALQFKAEQGLNEILHKEDGSDSIVSNETFLRFNNSSDQQRFRYYKTESQKPVHLYKMHEVKVPVLDSLELTHAPDKQSYYVGDTFDPTGMVITAKYTNDGEDKVIPGTEYTISPLDLELGNDHVTVSYEEDGVTKTVDVPVTVTKAPVPVTGVTLNQTELSIKVNDADVTLVATVAPEDADDKTVVWSVSQEGIVTVNGGVVHAVAEGTVTVTATAGDFHADCLVTVGAAEKVISGIEVVEQPTKTNYYVGDVFDPAGMEIKVTYSSGHDPIIITSGYTHSSVLLELGTEAIDIEYNGFHASIAITVEAAPVLTSISVEGPTKTEYNVGDVLDLTGLVVTANYDKGEPEVINSGYEVKIKNGETETAVTAETKVAVGDSLVVSYGGQIQNIALTINALTPILAEGTYLIKGYSEDGNKVYYLKENGTTKPTAVTDPDEATPFVFELKEGTTNEYTIKTLEEKVLYSTTANDGVKVDENKEFTWIIEEGVEGKVGGFNLKQTLALGKDETARYLTLYNESDFRTYNSATATNRKANTDFEVYHKKTLESISITNQPTKSSYYVGETFNPEGLVVNAHYAWEGGGGEDKIIDAYELDFSGAFTSEDVGTKTITATFGEKTATFDVTVEVRVATLVSISIEGTAKTDYEVGEAYSAEGLKVIAHYSDESTSEVTDSATITALKEIAETGDESVTFTAQYNELQATKEVAVTVAAANIKETLTVASLGLGSSYGGFSVVSEISGLLQGNATTSSQYGNIQMRDLAQGSGIYTRTSNRYIKSISFEFDSANGKTISVYGQNEGYKEVPTSATGDLLGSVTGDGKIVVEGNYLNILIASTGATYIKNIVLEWDSTAQTASVSSVTLNKSEVEMGTDGSENLTVIVDGCGCSQDVTWSSSNESVATVADGVITPVAGGETTIKATSVDNGQVYAECHVAVTSQKTVMKADFTTKAAGNTNYNDTEWAYGDFKLAFAANNNNGWDYVKLGAKFSTSGTVKESVGYVKSTVASTDQVNKIVVQIAAGSLSKTGMSVTEWGVEVYSDEACTQLVDKVVSTTAITKTAAEIVLEPTQNITWAAGSYFKIYFNCSNTSTTNGVVCVSSIAFIG